MADCVVKQYSDFTEVIDGETLHLNGASNQVCYTNSFQGNSPAESSLPGYPSWDYPTDIGPPRLPYSREFQLGDFAAANQAKVGIHAQPIRCVHILLQGENIADNGGMRQSFEAYRKYLWDNGREAPVPGLETITNEQVCHTVLAKQWKLVIIACSKSKSLFSHLSLRFSPFLYCFIHESFFFKYQTTLAQNHKLCCADVFCRLRFELVRLAIERNTTQTDSQQSAQSAQMARDWYNAGRLRICGTSFGHYRWKIVHENVPEMLKDTFSNVIWNLCMQKPHHKHQLIQFSD